MAKEVKMIPVESSNIESAGYQKKEQKLTIRFKGGSTYQYMKVEKEIFDGLMEAGSPGKFFHAKIRGKHTFKKLS